MFKESKRLKEWAAWEAAYSSELFGVEVRRMIDRLRLELALDDTGVAQAHEALQKMEASVGRILLSPAILHRASLPMPTAVKTLDALHLASAHLFQERREQTLIFATHDRQQGLAAKAFGFRVIGAE